MTRFGKFLSIPLFALITLYPPESIGAPGNIASKTIKVITADAPGSAFIIGPAANGTCVLVTAHHVIKENAPNEPLVFIIPKDQKTQKPKKFTLLKTSFQVAEDNLDLAFIPTSNCDNSVGLPLAKAGSIVISSKVSILGYPIDQESVHSVNTKPFVVDGRVTQYGQSDELGYDISYDASTKPGYSGGPVVSESGDEIIAVHGRSDTVKGNQDQELREQLRVGGRGISSALLYKFLKDYGYKMQRSDKVTCLVGVC
jgi:S1-C subfamily serine protease